MVIGVQLFDMYKTEAVSIMTAAEFRELKEELSEESRFFNNAYSAVRTEWTKTFLDAQKRGDKTFPKFPTKPFVWVRSCKTRNFTSKDAADKWLAKQTARLNAEHAAQAAAIKNAIKRAKGALASGYSSRDDKKARRRAEKADMDAAVKERLGEMVGQKLSTFLAFNRPIPKHFIFDPIEGPDKHTAKKMEQQDAALKAYRERKVKDAEEVPTSGK